MNILFLWVLLDKTPDIVGWTFPEMIFLYGVGELCFGLFAIFAFHVSVRLSDYYIIEGHFDRLLVRPIDPLMQLMMENLDVFDLMILLKGAMLVAWAWFYMPLEFNLINFASLILGVLCGALVYLGTFLGIGSLSFWMPDRGGLLRPLFSINDVSRYPITIYPLGVRLFFSYVIPFAFAVYYPAVWVLESGVVAWEVLKPLLMMTVFVTSLAYIVFNRGLSQYESTGT